MRRHIVSFPARDDSGNEIVVCVSQDFNDTSTFEGPGEVGGITHLTVGNMHGQRLNRLGKGEYATLLGHKYTSSDLRAV